MSFCRTSLYAAVAAGFALSAHAAAPMPVASTSQTFNPDQPEGLLSAPPTPRTGNAPQSDSTPDAQSAPAAVANEPSGNPLWAIPLKSLSFTRERPLFTPSRRPPAPAVAYVQPVPPVVLPPPAAPNTPRLALIGVIVGGRDSVAILVDQTTREVLRLRTNEGHDGWILRSIQGRDAILEKSPFTAILRLPRAGGEQNSEVSPLPGTGP
jgi:general secretion pathway protein N